MSYIVSPASALTSTHDRATPNGRRQPLSHGAEWTFELISEYDRAIREIAVNEFKLDCYPNQIEIINSEQMLDAYASVGLPIGYPHWSFGKEFIRNEHAYRKGARGLAYEIVINSDPCIAYLMEENSMPLQALVIAHASYGHNSFFKGNYLFRQWTSADAIIDYMVFARKYVMDCEARYGVGVVEETIDACHALMDFGVNRYRHPRPLSAADELRRLREREEYLWKQYDEIWRTVPSKARESERGSQAVFPEEPQENLLYFVEKYAPKLAPWQRELVRIVRKMAQYFYPQGQTKVMNEGWATFWHYTILNRLYDKGLVDDGFMLEVLQSHTNVVTQRGFDEQGYGGMNPYALGFAMMSDLRRICERDGLRGPRVEAPRGGGPPVVPRHRRRRLAEGAGLRDAQLQGRVVHRPVPLAAADPRVPPVRGGRPRAGRPSGDRLDPQRGRLPARAQAARAAVQPRQPVARHPDRPLRARRQPQPDPAASAPPQPPAQR